MDYPSPEMYFHPEMRGKCWIIIIRIQFPQIPSLEWDVLFYSGWQGQLLLHRVYFAVLNTYLYRFHQAPKIIQKEHKEWPSQLPYLQLLRHQNRVFNASTFPFNKCFAPFFSGLNAALHAILLRQCCCAPKKNLLIFFKVCGCKPLILATFT